MTAGVDEFLARANDVLADWEGSDDAATWAADGSHEHEVYPYAYLDAGPSGEPWIPAWVWEACVSAYDEAFERFTALVLAGLDIWRPNVPTFVIMDETARWPSLAQDEVESRAAGWLRSWRRRKLRPRHPNDLSPRDGGDRLAPGPLAGCLSPLTAAPGSRLVGIAPSLPAASPTTGPAPARRWDHRGRRRA